MVATNQLPLSKCPHIDSEKLKEYQQKFDQQYASGTFVKTDIARDALEWAKKRSASMVLEDVAVRIGGRLIKEGDQTVLELPYFSDSVVVGQDSIKTKDGSALNHWDQILIYNHMAQGGDRISHWYLGLHAGHPQLHPQDRLHEIPGGGSVSQTLHRIA